MPTIEPLPKDPSQVSAATDTASVPVVDNSKSSVPTKPEEVDALQSEIEKRRSIEQLVASQKYFVKTRRPKLTEKLARSTNVAKRKKLAKKQQKDLESKYKSTSKTDKKGIKPNASIPVSEKKKMALVIMLLVGFYLLVDARILLPDFNVPIDLIKSNTSATPPVDVLPPIPSSNPVTPGV